METKQILQTDYQLIEVKPTLKSCHYFINFRLVHLLMTLTRHIANNEGNVFTKYNTKQTDFSVPV